MNTEVKQTLDELLEQGNGLLKPEAVVEAARPESSPLHSHFEWNDSKAAEKYRLDQARVLIRSVYIEHPNDATERVHAYVSLPSDRVDGNGYRAARAVIKSDHMVAQLADEMREKVAYWCRQLKLLGVELDPEPMLAAVNRVAPARTKRASQGSAPPPM